MLANDPDVHGGGELNILPSIVDDLHGLDKRTLPYPELARELDRGIVDTIATKYNEQVLSLASGAKRITDKMLGNFLYVGLIYIVFPNAAIVHTVRDPVDTCISCFSHLFSGDIDYSYDLRELGRYYSHYLRLMEHWRRVLLHDRILEVKYEEVVGDLEGQGRRLLTHCGLPWDDRCLSFFTTKRPVQTSSLVQVRQPIYRSSMGRWRAYAEYIAPLFEELGIEAPAQREMQTQI